MICLPLVATGIALLQNLACHHPSERQGVRVLQVDKMPLDLYAIFKAVAQRGGYQAVSVQRLVIDVKSRALSSEAAPRA